MGAKRRGSVDAWVIWDPFLAAVEKQTGARILADGRGVVNNYAYYLAERGYAERCPQVHERCRSVAPKMHPVGHQTVRCHLYDPAGRRVEGVPDARL